MTINFELLDRALSIVTKEGENALVTVSAERLTEPEQARQLLTLYREQIKGRDIQVASTYYAACWRVIPAALLYMLTACDGRVDFSLQNLTIQIDIVNNYPRVFFVLKRTDVLPWPTGPAESWRERELGGFVQETLRPVLETASSISGLPLGQIWGQIPLGVEFYLNYMADQLGDLPLKERLGEQYVFFSKQLGPEWFGLKRNPFDVKAIWLDDPYRPGERTRMKPTCCLAYRTDTGHGYCYGCPKISKEERERKRREILAAAASNG
ncbi:(2Fe-2S)-binding protein [Paenibacillus sanfengchensis]|uniref:(2Fe-2S)-binding protein n=1 Tax=Paenibacillus sanfengchensis TaxID=3119819 RepID=UPI002FE2345B